MILKFLSLSSFTGPRSPADKNRKQQILRYHATIRHEVQQDIQRLFARVETAADGVEDGVYSFPADGGREVMWEHALASAKHMLAMIPPYPAWYDSPRDDWLAPGYWDALAKDELGVCATA